MSKLKEIELLPVLKNGFDYNDSKNMSYIEELSSGYGIADLVFYEFEKEVVDSRNKLNLGAIDSLEVLNILTKLSLVDESILSLTFLNDLTGGKLKNNNGIVSYLVEKGFLTPLDSSNELFEKGLEYRIGLKSTIAIEAKLSNWKRGLYQAYRYKQFANLSYLAIYSKNVHRALKHLDLFKTYNVGLISVDKNNIEILYNPTKETVSSNHYSAFAYENILKWSNSVVG